MAKATTAPRADLVDKEPTELHSDFASYIKEQTGYDADDKSVQLATILRMDFQRSEKNQSRLAARKESRESEAQARAERAEARAAKAQEKEAAKSERAAAKKSAPAAKKSAPAKKAATPAASKTAASGGPRRRAAKKA